LTTPSPQNDLPLTYSDGRSASATDTTYQTSYGYDSAGNRTGITTPPVQGFSSGRTTTITYTDGTSVLAYGSSTTYAPPGLPYTQTTPGGAVPTTTYYADGHVPTVTDPLGKVTSHTYDNLGRVATTTVTWGSNSAATSFTYDSDGQVLTRTDPVTTDAVTGYT